MKRFKKALAALLATLMVVCSMPLTALANTFVDPPCSMSLEVFAQDREIWGPNLEAGEGEGAAYSADTQLYAGDGIALVWVLHDMDTFSEGQIKGWVDSDKIMPAYYKKQGARYTLTTGAVDTATYAGGTNFIGGMENDDQDNVIMTDGTNLQLEDGFSNFAVDDTDAAEQFGWPLGEGVGVVGFTLAKTNMHDPGNGLLSGVNLTGTTVFNYIYNPDAPDDYDAQYVIDGTMFCVTRMMIMEDMLVSDIYNYIHPVTDDLTINFMSELDRYNGTSRAIKFGPYEGGNGTTEATYTFADGTTTTAAEAPANTVVANPINNNNGTHTTGYKWVADGDNAFVEQAVTADCSDFAKKTVETTCVVLGYDEYTCNDCGYTYKDNMATEYVDHDFSVPTGNKTTATCTVKGTVEMECSYGCGTTTNIEGALDPTNHTNVVTDEAVEATCTATGLTEGSHCEDCGAVIVPQEETPMIPHTYGEGVVTKAPTRAEDGVMTYTCTVCGNEKTEAIEALGVLVTVDGKELGTATINGADAYGTTKVKYGATYTLTAAPLDGAEFVGWMSNGKMLTNEATYTTAAYADMTYTPVFAEAGQATFTVTFVDTYGNVISVLDSNAVAALTEMPAANELAGYTFKEWSMTLDEVKALTDSATVYAYYETDEADAYTITAAGCTITVNGVDYTDVATGVAYNSKVTVTPAESVYAEWSVNGASAAYGETYSFLCGSDATVTYAEATAAVPTVAAVSATKTATSNVAFLATRSVPEGYTLIESGFVYGKAMAEEDLVLENVGTVQGTDNGKVKSIACRNVSADGQFSLTYGVSAMNQNACARAYLIYADATGATYAIYSDAMIYTY